MQIACFITPHGFGHAARACAVMESLAVFIPEIQFEIFTTVPEWFFKDSIPNRYNYHYLKTDIGLAQLDPLNEDLPETLEELRSFLPISPILLDNLAETLLSLKCRLVLCDISALGLAAATLAGLPTFLIENFTWDWIYSNYLSDYPEFSAAISQFESLCSFCHPHLQTEPLCRRDYSASAYLPPISRTPRNSAEQTRLALGIGMEKKVVLLTMGGMQPDYSFLKQLSEFANLTFLIPGTSDQPQQFGSAILLPHHNSFFHPDLIHASDAIIAKVGYSTIAEAYYPGVPIGYITRPRFRESLFLASFIESNLLGIEISPETFQTGEWIQRLDELLSFSKKPHFEINGAIQAASYILNNI